ILSGAALHNMYGPTEAALDVTAWCYQENASRVAIGRPIANISIYSLGRDGNAVPRGCVGELYIGGAGVARGYLNQAELTAERFVPDPNSPLPGARMYRTGDLARHRTDGNLEFIGRNDDQVKVRG